MKIRLHVPACSGIIVCCAVLSGCANGNSDYSQYLQIIKQSFRGTFSDRAITRTQAAAIPYASLGYRLNGGTQNLLVLATDTNGDFLWTSASHVVLVTRDGRLIRTVGLPDNIDAVSPSLSTVMTPPSQALKSAFTSIRSADFPDEGLYSVAFSCRTVNRGRELVTILGKAMDTVRTEERCQNSSLSWSFQNNYWIDVQTGFVWRSLQHLSPRGGTVEIEVLRPPG